MPLSKNVNYEDLLYQSMGSMKIGNKYDFCLHMPVVSVIIAALMHTKVYNIKPS